MKKLILFLSFSVVVLSQQITTNNVQPGSKQGNGTKFQLASNSISGTGAILCTDANGNTSTLNCSTTVINFFSATSPIVYTAGNYSCPTCVVTSGSYANPTWITTLDWAKIINTSTVVQTTSTYSNPAWLLTLDWSKITGVSTVVQTTNTYADPNWITSLAWAKLTGLPSLVNTFNGRTGTVVPATNDYTWTQIGGPKQGNTNVPQMAGTNSGTAGAPLCNDANGNSTTTGCTSVTTGSAPFQRFRSAGVTPYNGGFVNRMSAYAADFNYTVTPSSPATLTGGTTNVTVTLPYGPPGLVTSGTYATPVYLSSGFGAAESVIPTGGTCGYAGSGTSCTIIISPANSHSGGWTVSSADAGYPEAAQYNLGTSGSTFCGKIIGNSLTPDSFHTQWTVPQCSITITAESASSGGIVTATDFTGNAVIYFTGTLPNQEISEIKILNYNAVLADDIVFSQTGYFNVHDIWCGGGNSCVRTFSSGGRITNSLFYAVNGPGQIIIGALSAIAGKSNDVLIANNDMWPGNNSHAIFLTDADGVLISGIKGACGNPFIYATPTYVGVNSTIIDHMFVDEGSGACGSTSVYGVGLYGGVSNTVYVTGISVRNSQINGDGTSTPYNILLSNPSGTGGSVTEIDISNNLLGGSVTGSIYSNYGDQITVRDNKITCSPSAPNAACINLNVSTNTDITNNSVTASGSGYAILSQGHSDKLNVIGNSLAGPLSFPVNLDNGFAIYPTPMQMIDNIGMDTILPTTADNAALIIGLTPNFIITGTGTGITSLSNVGSSCWIGRKGTFYTRDGNITFTAGATIGNSFTTTQNVPVSYYCDGTKIWMH